MEYENAVSESEESQHGIRMKRRERLQGDGQAALRSMRLDNRQ